MTELRLTGCTTRPLGSYLKALGVLRLVGKQLDRAAKGRWLDDTFLLDTTVGADEVMDFLLTDYQPTPIVTPWNGRSGFNTARNRKSEKVLAGIESSTDGRLAGLRACIRAGRWVYGKAAASDWQDKEQWIQACRATFPDEALEWLDAIAVLTEDRAAYPFLLGTGGNLGSMDLSNNFLERLGDALGTPAGPKSPGKAQRGEWLKAALFGIGSPVLKSAAPGQFDPGSKARELVNPWDYVLTLEGSLLFASGAARRMGEGGRGSASMPFMVGRSGVGYPSSLGEENSRGEIWCPIWRRPVTYPELARLIGEGRSAWGRSQALTGLDFARAASSLGVDRGIASFQRHSFLERHGQDMIAVPTSALKVLSRPEVPVLGQLDRWLSQVRRARELPNSVRDHLHRVDQAQFEVAIEGGPRTLQDVLVAVSELEALVARSTKLRDEQVRTPVPPLPAAQWVPLLDDGSREFRIAAALASQSDALSRGQLDMLDRIGSRINFLLRPIQLDERRRLAWSDGPTRVPGLGIRPLVEVLAAALRRRALDAMAERQRGSDAAGPGQVGIELAYDFALPAPGGDIAAFVVGDTDDGRIEELLRGCLLLDWTGRRPNVEWPSGRFFDMPPAPAWAVTAPFFAPGAPDEAPLRAGASWPHQLIAGRVDVVVGDALRRLRIAHLRPSPADVEAISAGIDGQRLAAGLLVPISRRARSTLLERVASKEEMSEAGSVGEQGGD